MRAAASLASEATIEKPSRRERLRGRLKHKRARIEDSQTYNQSKTCSEAHLGAAETSRMCVKTSRAWTWAGVLGASSRLGSTRKLWGGGWLSCFHATRGERVFNRSVTSMVFSQPEWHRQQSACRHGQQPPWGPQGRPQHSRRGRTCWGVGGKWSAQIHTPSGRQVKNSPYQIIC